VTRGELPAAVFLNEGARAGRTPRIRRTVDLVRAALDADLHVLASRSPDEVRAWLRQEATGYRTCVIAGGDGTLGIAFNVLANREAAIGYIPAGFGNATSHLLHLPHEADALAEVIVHGEVRPVDLVSVDGRLALFAGAGWDAHVTDRYHRSGAHGLAGWAWAVMTNLPRLLRRTDVEVTADGNPIYAGPVELVVVGTTPYYGRGLLVNPGARVDAGRLTARIYPGPVLSATAEMLRWVARRTPRARPIGAAQLELRTVNGDPILLQADGDVIGERPAWGFTSLPGAVRLIGRWC
jgi:diacylglycerol kinase (ATP)